MDFASIGGEPYTHQGRKPNIELSPKSDRNGPGGVTASRSGGSGVLEIIDFEEADAGLAGALVDDGGVGAGWDRGDDGGFEVV